MGKSKSCNISREKIVDYWKGRIKINCSWEEAETHCWACGSDKFGTLERSHIIPNCLGGIMHQVNLVLLCMYCNRECPETYYGYDFMLWLKSRRKKGKDYHLDSNNPLSIDKEYENIYGKEMFKKSTMKRFDFYFGFERFTRCFIIYTAPKYKNTFYLRYPSTFAIMYNKYKKKVSEAVNYILENEIKEKEEYLKIFYQFLNIPHDEYRENHVFDEKVTKKSVKPRKPKVKSEEEIIEYGPCINFKEINSDESQSDSDYGSQSDSEN